MILNMACFYLVLGACGILWRAVRNRPHHSAFHYSIRVLFIGGWILLPIGALAELGGQSTYIWALGLVCASMFVLIVRRGLQHVQAYIDQTDYPY